MTIKSRIKDLATSTLNPSNDDYVVLDGETNGTRKILVSDLYKKELEALKKQVPITIMTKVNSFTFGKTEGMVLSVALSEFPLFKDEIIVTAELDSEDFILSRTQLRFTKENYSCFQDIAVSYKGESYSTGSCFSTLVLSGDNCLLKEIELKVVDNGVELLHKEEYNMAPSFHKWAQLDGTNMIVNKVGIRDLDINLTAKGKSPLISNLNGFREGVEYVILFDDITPDINILLMNADWSRQTHIDSAKITSPHTFIAELDYTQINFNPKSDTSHIYMHNFHIVPKEYYDALKPVEKNLVQQLEAKNHGIIEDEDNTINTNILPPFNDSKWQGLSTNSTAVTSEKSFEMIWNTGEQAPLISNLKPLRTDKQYTITFDDMQKDMYIFIVNPDWTYKMIIDCNTITSPYVFTPDRDDYTQVTFNPKSSGTRLYATNCTITYDAPTVTDTILDKSGNGNDLLLDQVFDDTDFKDVYLYTANKGIGKASNLAVGGLKNLTVTFGFRVSSFKAKETLFDLGGGLKVELNNNRLEVYVNGTSLGLTSEKALSDIVLDDPLDVTIAINEKKFKLYQNGFLAVEKVLNSSINLTNGLKLLGDGTNNTDILFKYFMVYDVALSQEDIEQNYCYNNAGFVYKEDYHVVLDDIYSYLIEDNEENFNANKFRKHDLAFFVDKNQYFLRPDGDDNNDGLSRQTPIKTFEKYKEIINANNFEKSTLFIENGTYTFNNTFNLIDGKFGDSCEINFKAIGNNVIFTAGEKLDNTKFTKTTLNGKDNVYVYDLSSIDIDFAYNPSNANTFESAPFVTYGDDRLYIASYPKKDRWTKSVEDQATLSGNGFKFTVRDNDVINLTRFDNVILDSFVTTPYSNYFDYIESYSNKVITTKTKYKNPGIQPYTSGMMYRIINSIELLTDPGEYFIDYAAKKLYLIPPDDGIKYTPIRLVHRNIESTFINNNTDTEYSEYYKGAKVNFERINFDGYRKNVFTGALSHMHFKDCRFINVGGDAINPTNTHYLSIDNCRFKNNSGMSIKLQNSTNGEVRKKLLDSNIKIRNCVFKNGGYCHSYLGYQFAIQVEAVGAKIERCCFDHYPGIVIRYQQNNNTIEKSIFRDSCYILLDTGCLYTGRDVLSRGNKILGNYLYGNNSYHGESSNYGTTGLYLDDMACGNILMNNITVGFKHGIQIGGGRDNIVANNIFENSTTPVWNDARGTSWMNLNQSYWAIDVLDEVWLNDLWTGQYPGVESIPTRANFDTTNSADNEYALPRGNKLYNNVHLNPKSNQTFNQYILKYGEFEGNKTV